MDSRCGIVRANRKTGLSRGEGVEGWWRGYQREGGREGGKGC